MNGISIELAPFRAAAQLSFHSSGTQRRKHSDVMCKHSYILILRFAAHLLWQSQRVVLSESI